MVLFRRLLGDVLRDKRTQRGLTLREVSAEARVSLGYISEIERGQKEASSELLYSLCDALEVPLSDVLREVSDAVAVEEAAALLTSLEPDPRAQPLRGRRLRRLTLVLVSREVRTTQGLAGHLDGGADLVFARAAVVDHRRERRVGQRVDLGRTGSHPSHAGSR